MVVNHSPLSRGVASMAQVPNNNQLWPQSHDVKEKNSSFHKPVMSMGFLFDLESRNDFSKYQLRAHDSSLLDFHDAVVKTCAERSGHLSGSSQLEQLPLANNPWQPQLRHQAQLRRFKVGGPNLCYTFRMSRGWGILV